MEITYVLKDAAVNTSSAITALTEGEIGLYGIKSDGTWGAVDATTDAEFVGFGIGVASGVPLRTPLFKRRVKGFSVTKKLYQADVKPSVAITITKTGTLGKTDQFSVKFSHEAVTANTSLVREVFEVVGSKADATAIATDLAATINADSLYFTAASSGAVVTVTAKAHGTINVQSYFEDNSSSGATVSASVNPSSGTIGSGTAAEVKEMVRESTGNFGKVETSYRYEGNIPTQNVSGTKYTIIQVTFKEDYPTGDTKFTNNKTHVINFCCDVTATTPSSLVDDLMEIFNYVLLDRINEVPA